jgi:carboxypeptidase family protein
MTAKIILCLAIALVLSGHAPGQTPTGSFKGVVTDPSGAVIPNATVLVHRDWPEQNTQNLRLNTDKFGRFSIELAPGFYDRNIRAGIFSNSGKVRIRGSQATHYTAKLAVDPQWIANLETPSLKIQCL